MMESGSCGFCGRPANMACGGCSSVRYCGKAHQKQHWSLHKKNCKLFIEVQTEDAGRQLVASRNIPPGALIIKEKPFCLGPVAFSLPVCLTCLSPIDGTPFYPCASCSWPMCDAKCSASHVHSRECQILSRDVKKCGVPYLQEPTPRYDLVLVLRCLLLRDANPTTWNALQDMVSHFEVRKKEEEPHHVAAVRYLTEVCKVGSDIDMVHRVRGAVVTNSIKTRTANGVMVRGLYSQVSRINHSCFPNVTLRSDRNHVVYVHSTVEIPRGDSLAFSYVSPCLPLWQRHAELLSLYCFNCRCTRCCSPSENLAYVSVPKCPHCKKGMYENHISSFKCDSCFHEIDSRSLEHFSSRKEAEILERLSLSGPDEAVALLDELAKTFHEKHYLWITAAQRALTILGKQEGFLEAELQIRRHLLHCYQILEPGMTRRRGVSLYEVARCMLRIAEERRLKNKDSLSNCQQTNDIATDTTAEKIIEIPTEGETVFGLKDIKQILEESVKILGLESPDSTEFSWKLKAQNQLDYLRLIS